MSAKHTPGPHKVEQIGRRPLMRAVAATVLAHNSQRLADFRHVADANLFAAAPELLEALKAIRRACIDQGINFGPLVADAEAAISKAEGQAPPVPVHIKGDGE